MKRSIFARLACTLGLAAAASPALADSIEDFYKGKTVSLVVSSSTGGGYDTLARLLPSCVS